MRYFPTRPRRLLVCLGVATGVLAAAAIALAAYPQDSVTVLTGCLSTGGTGGNISNVAVGSSPTKSCGPNGVLIHLSGGTITQVSAGAGLTGGGSNGYVTLGVDPKYQLPQNGCSTGQFVASDGAGGWSCQSQKTYGGSDFALSNQSCDSGQFLTGIDASGRKLCGADQTYTNGTGIDLNGNSFRLISSYRLPQGCNSGEVATSARERRLDLPEPDQRGRFVHVHRDTLRLHRRQRHADRGGWLQSRRLPHRRRRRRRRQCRTRRHRPRQRRLVREGHRPLRLRLRVGRRVCVCEVPTPRLKSGDGLRGPRLASSDLDDQGQSGGACRYVTRASAQGSFRSPRPAERYRD